MAKVLVVEDDRDLAHTLKDLLSAEHHAVDIADNGSDAETFFQDCRYDVIILDVQLPKQDGISVLKAYRRIEGTGSVIMLTSRSSIADKLHGLDSGADDYLTKPFEARELISRVRAQLRRSASAPYVERLVSGGLSLEIARRVCKRGEMEVRLQPKEFGLLEFLMRHQQEVFSSEALLHRVWPSTADVTAGHLRVIINSLRGKIDSPGEPSHIETVHRAGYRFRQTSSPTVSVRS